MKCKLLIGFYDAKTGETVFIAENITAVVTATGNSMDNYENIQRYISRALNDKKMTFNFNGIRCHVHLVPER